MIALYEPAFENLWFRQAMLADERTMSYNHSYGGSIPFPKEKWAPWYDRWVINHENKRFYRFVKENDTFLGEVAYRFDDERHIYIADVIIYAPHRGNGYGRQALTLLCDAARKNGINELYDDIAVDNSSVSMFLNCGFRELLRTEDYVLVKKELGENL